MSNFKASAAQLYPDFPWVPPRDQRIVQMIYKQAKAFYRGGFPKEYLVTDLYQTGNDNWRHTIYNSKNLTLGQFQQSSPGPRTVHQQILFSWGSFGLYQRHYSSQTANRWWIFLFFWSLLCLEHWPKRGAGLGRSQTVSSFLFQRAI